MQYETGQGKTALCLGIAVTRALRGETVFILNHSPELTFRDHKKAHRVEEIINVPILRLSQNFDLPMSKGAILYATIDELTAYLDLIGNKADQNAVLVIDEYDSIFFEEASSWSASNRFTQMFETIIALSGSELMAHHKQEL